MNKYVNETISLQHFRLRTVRHKKRMQREDKDKQLIALHKEEHALYKQRHNLGWIDLNPPVMRGWKRFFALRSDVAKSKQAAFFEGILGKINTTDYSNRKDFKVKKRKWGKKMYIVKEQGLWQPNEYYFNKLKLSEAEKVFFEERYVQHKWTKKPQKVFVFTEPWRFVLRVRPNIITKIRVRDEAIEKRTAEIRNYLMHNALIGQLDRLLRGHSYSWHEGEKESEKNPLQNKPLPAILDEYYTKAYAT